MTTEPTDAELKAMWQLHAADIGGIFYYARAVLAKWGAPAPAQDDSLTAAYMAGAHDANAAARAATPEWLASFAALVAAAERRECARVCQEIEDDRWELYKGRLPYTGREPECGQPHTYGRSDGAGECADAIRARSKP